ncbi:MAG TPA: hypothetical protein VMR19_03470 [Candidatus Saccharimonadales bacterium]|nr:hypothetical protein [Candidatus Saccharimonadales bacterium]
MFFPSLFGFYTNDDFFDLKISHFHSLTDFLNSFNLLKGPEGWGLYRPLTVQVFFSSAWTIFNLNPFYLHIVLFIMFFILIFLVYWFILLISKNEKMSLVVTFLYATSATHFGHLYFLSTQELGLGIFVLLSIIYGLKFFREGKKIYYAISLIAFILSICSKETAVITPFLLATVVVFDRLFDRKEPDFKKLIYRLVPYLTILVIYFYFRIFHYGFTTGDSYVWNFSVKRLMNTLTWYFVWSFNLPESLVDFLGPGIHINPNLWLYWSKQIIPILILFVVEIFVFIYAFVKSLIINRKPVIGLFAFSVLWFLVSILPVAFLPLHKFTFYLTLPLIGIVFLLSYLFTNLKSKIYIIFCIVWISLSILTIKYAVNTNWITQGEAVSQRVYDYFLQNKSDFSGKAIVFVDTPDDATLPWSPTATLKTVLSDKNFFDVFYPDLSAKVNYTGLAKPSFKPGTEIIGSRQFLGY